MYYESCVVVVVFVVCCAFELLAFVLQSFFVRCCCCFGDCDESYSGDWETIQQDEKEWCDVIVFLKLLCWGQQSSSLCAQRSTRGLWWTLNVMGWREKYCGPRMVTCRQEGDQKWWFFHGKKNDAIVSVQQDTCNSNDDEGSRCTIMINQECISTIHFSHNSIQLRQNGPKNNRNA